MQLTTGPPLLFALGIRIFLNLINPEHSPSTSDHLLVGLWQGILLYHTLIHLPDFVFAVALGIAAKLFFDISRGFETAKCASTILGIALGVLIDAVLSQVLEDGSFADTSREGDRQRSSSGIAQPRESHEPTPRRRVVSFGRSNDRHRPSNSHSHRHTRERAHTPEPRRHNDGYNPAYRDITSPTPTLAYSVDTAPSISMDSVASSIDPKGIMTPAQREVAILRRRASLADSERRRFKEERKWAISMGNKARANQLAWQVKRYAALMESFHREADAKVVEAARVTVPQQGSTVSFPASAGPSTSTRRPSQSRSQQPVAGPSTAPTDRQPLVSVTVGTAPSGSRVRKRSAGAASGSTLRPAIRVTAREAKR